MADAAAPAGTAPGWEEGSSQQAPIRLMTLFLKAVSEQRMAEALALTYHILKYEPRNAMVLEYRDVLTRHLAIQAQAGGTCSDEDSGSGDEGSRSSGDASSSEGESSEGDTEDASCDEHFCGTQAEAKAERHDRSDGGRTQVGGACKEEARLAGMMADLQVQAAQRGAADRAAWDPAQFDAEAKESAAAAAGRPGRADDHK